MPEIGKLELVKKLVIDLKNSVYNVPRNKDLWRLNLKRKMKQ